MMDNSHFKTTVERSGEQPSTNAADTSRFCPNCGSEMLDSRCKLACPGCGFFLSCSDFY